MQAMYKPMGFVRAGTAYRMAEGAGLMVMVGVTVPLWRERLAAGVSEARSMVAMADADVAAMRRMVQGETCAAREQVVAARVRLLTARERIVPLAKQTVSLTLAGYASGQVPLVAVLEASRAFRDARMDEAVAEVRLAGAWARLGRAVGTVGVAGR